MTNFPYFKGLNESIRDCYFHVTDPHRLYQAAENQNVLCRLLNQLYAEHSALLVISLVLRYRGDYANQIKRSQVQEDIATLLRHRSRQPDLFSSMLGQMLALECGQFGGNWQLHALFFYDGDCRQDELEIGYGVGRLWQHSTSGRGSYKLNNADKGAAAARATLGIGMVHREDRFMRSNLIEHVAGYILRKADVLEISVVKWL